MRNRLFARSLVATLLSSIIAACGGGGGGSTTSNGTNSTATVPTQAEIFKYSDSQISALGSSFALLSDSALGALSPVVNENGGLANPKGQIESITATEIQSLSVAQVQMIGTTGSPTEGTLPAQIQYLNPVTWAQLVSDPSQVAALTAAEVSTLTGAEITAIVPFNSLNNAALGELGWLNTDDLGAPSQISSITATQIRLLSSAQVQLIGTTGMAQQGTLPAALWDLNPVTWEQLVSDPKQVAALTAAEIPTFSGAQIAEIGPFNSLTNAALGALGSDNTNDLGAPSQISSIVADQIKLLTPEQVQAIGSTGTPQQGIVMPKLWNLNPVTWAQLTSESDQVAALTAQEISSFSGAQIAAITQFGALSDDALVALGWLDTNDLDAPSQLISLTASQISALTPEQLGVVATINGGRGVSYLNLTAFAAMDRAQIAVLTAAEKAWFSPQEHTLCGC